MLRAYEYVKRFNTLVTIYYPHPVLFMYGVLIRPFCVLRFNSSFLCKVF